MAQVIISCASIKVIIFKIMWDRQKTKCLGEKVTV